MSRIGKSPIAVPAGVQVEVDGRQVVVKGPKGELAQRLAGDIMVGVDGGEIQVQRPSDAKAHRALHGLTRSLIANMVQGVVNGYERVLVIRGVGYRAAKQGTKLVLNVGYSHSVEIDPPAGIEIEVPQATRIVVKGIDKQLVGQVAADIRQVRPPEPYLGKGIAYENEHIRRKAGKAGRR